MQPNDSVHHETIKLVSLNLRLRKRMAGVLSTTAKLARPGGCRGVCGHSRRRLTQTPLQQSTIHDVQRAFLDVERGLPDCFAQRWVGMAGASDIFRAAAKLNHRNSFGD